MLYYESDGLLATQELARQCGRLIQPGTLILLQGPLGSGKTAFTQALGKQLGVQRAIKSPTYTIIKEYDLPDRDYPLIHVDAYRLEEGGADTVDLAPYLNGQTICVIEWPQFIQAYLPNNYLLLEFEPQGLEGRRITLSLSDQADRRHRDLIDQLDQHFAFQK